MVESANEDLVNAYLERGIYITKLESGLQNEIMAMLKALEVELIKILSDVDLDSGNVSQRLIRLDHLKAEVQAIISQYYQAIEEKVKDDASKLASSELFWMNKTLNGYFGVDLFNVVLNEAILESLVGDMMVQGAPSSAWWAMQDQTTLFNFMKEMRLGIMQGESLSELVRRVRGRRENGFKDGVLSIPTRNAESLVITSAQTILNNARMEVYKQNSDLLMGLQWHTALDYRVCVQCRPRDGAMWDFEGNPLNESARMFAFQVPPIHYSDRCILIPVLPSWEELASRFGGNTEMSKLLDQVPESTRSSINGQVPSTMTFEKWLKKMDSLDAEKVESMLGPKRYSLWKSGNLSLGDFLDDRGNVLKLSQIR